MQRNHQWNKVCHLPSGAIWVAHSSVVEVSVKSLRTWKFINVMLIDCSNPDCLLIGHLLTNLQVSHFLYHKPVLLPHSYPQQNISKKTTSYKWQNNLQCFGAGYSWPTHIYIHKYISG
jgi:hypothetical protein